MKSFTSSLIFYFILLLLLLNSCGTPPDENTPQPTVSPSVQATLIPSSIPTSTQPIPTITAAPTPTTTPRPMSVIEQRCIQVEDGFPTGIPGLVVIKGGDTDYILNLSNQEKTEFEASIDMVISPDSSKLLYSDLRLDAIVVRDSTMNILWQQGNADYEFSVAGWLDNSHILLAREPEDEDQEQWTLISYDLLSGEQFAWDDALPGINTIPGQVRWLNITRIIPHPYLNYLIYPVFDDPEHIALWDVDQQRIIKRVYHGSRMFQPLWSLDGASFITIAPPYVDYGQVYTNTSDLVADAPQILQVDLTGKVTALTNLPLGEYSAINYFQWSPDGQQIAFGHLIERKPPEEPGRLSILELSSGVITDYCMTGMPEWSPDGQYILLTHIDDQWAYWVYLVKLDTAQAWLIAENAEAIGWMVAP